MDIADYAAEVQDAFLEAAISAVVIRGREAADPARASARFCRQCGEPIPRPRRAALPGCRLCLECAEANEMAARTYRYPRLEQRDEFDS